MGGIAPVGTKITRQVSVRWALNKSIVVAQITTVFEGRAPVVSTEDCLLEPQGKQIAPLDLLARRERFGVWSKDGDDWLLKWSNAMANGVVGCSRAFAMRENRARHVGVASH